MSAHTHTPFNPQGVVDSYKGTLWSTVSKNLTFQQDLQIMLHMQK